MTQRPDPGTLPPETTDSLAHYVKEVDRSGFGSVTNQAIEHWILRVMFFEMMNRHCKKELKELYDLTVPLYRALVDLGRSQCGGRADLPVLVLEFESGPNQTTSAMHRIHDWNSLCFAADLIEPAGVLKNRMLKWIGDHHLACPWFSDAAVKSIGAWYLQGNGSTPEWTFTGGMIAGADAKFGSDSTELMATVVSLGKKAAPPQVPIYNPAMETSAAHFRALEAKVKAYYANQENAFLDAGFTRSTPRRRRSGDQWQHLRWFVLYQIRDRSAKEIAGCGKRKVTPPAVINAAKEIAEMLAIPFKSGTSK